MTQDKRYWEEEHKKCVSSAYYFYINYVEIKEADGTTRKATTRMTEEEFNGAYNGLKEEDLILGKNNMDFRVELAKWGYNKGNSIDVETLIDEILPTLFSKQERSYSEEEVIDLLIRRESFLKFKNKKEIYVTATEWFEQFKKK